jgi:hypothetical protein
LFELFIKTHDADSPVYIFRPLFYRRRPSG